MEGTSMDIWGRMKGQGATEYLVLLAVVLIVAMVAIALLGFFPGIATGARETQSDAYWRGEARPFAVLEHSQSGGTLSMVLQNVDAEQRAINTISIGGQGSNATVTPTNPFYSAGERRNLNVTGLTNCTSGTTYEYWVNISYNNSDNTIPNQKQFGAKTLVGMCA